MTQNRTKINPCSTVCGTISTRCRWNWICRRGSFVFAREARTSRLTHNILKVGFTRIGEDSAVTPLRTYLCTWVESVLGGQELQGYEGQNEVATAIGTMLKEEEEEEEKEEETETESETDSK
eukprot:scaffold13449_cov188-Amphora_coffeaeformis.AAC.5